MKLHTKLLLALVLGIKLGITGAAMAAVIAEATGFIAGLVVASRLLGGRFAISRARLLDPASLKRLFAVNRDIMLRTAALIAAFLFFTAQGARNGDLTLAHFCDLWLARASSRLLPACDWDPPRGQVIGLDFTFEMLRIAKTKRVKLGAGPKTLADKLTTAAQKNIAYINGDAQALPFADASRDVVSIAFGIRNVAEPAAAIREFHRVLRPGGRLIILEFSLPTNPLLRGLYNFYFRKILPRTATLISGDKTGAYKYLPQSVNTFIGREGMVQMMSDAGFRDVTQHPLTFGVCVCYRGRKLV